MQSLGDNQETLDYLDALETLDILEPLDKMNQYFEK